MKTLQTLICLAVLSLVGKSAGQQLPWEQIPPFTNFVGMGSMDRAIREYFVPNSLGLRVSVYQQLEDGTRVGASPEKLTAGVSLQYTLNGKETKLNNSKEQIDGIYRTNLIALASCALTNDLIDKDLPLRIFAYTSKYHPNFASVNYLWVWEEFKLVQGVNGKYSLPDFSQKTMGVVGYILYDIPGLRWIRIEGTNAELRAQDEGEENPPTLPYDSRNIESEWFIRQHEALVLPTDLVTSGRITKISTSVAPDNTLKVYGSDGFEKIPEPTRLGRMTTSSFHIFGEVGRTVEVLWSEKVEGPWSQQGGLITLPSYPVEFVPETATGFFRTRNVDMVPQ